MKPHPIGLYLLCVILVKFCKAQNGYHYNRPTGKPFLPTSNNQIPNSNQKLSGAYQPQGSQKSYQNEFSPRGYQYNRPSFKFSTTPSPQSQTVGFPQPFRPNSGATSEALYTTTGSPFSGNTNPTTYRGTVGAEFSGTTSNPFVGNLSGDRITTITSSPFNSKGSLETVTSTTTSSPFNTYYTSQASSNGDYNYQTPASSLTLNRDYGSYQPGSDANTIPGTGFDYGSNNQFGSSSSTEQPYNFAAGNSGNTAAGGQIGSQGYNNFDSSTAGDLGTNFGYGGNSATSNPISGNVIQTGSFNQRPGTSNTGSYNQNSATGLSLSNIENKNPGSLDTADSNAGNTGISNSNELYNENLIPQGTNHFGPGTITGYGSNFQAEGSSTQRPNSFISGNTGPSDSNNPYGGNQGPRRPGNFNNGDSSIRRPGAGYGGNSGLSGSNSGGVNNYGSNNAYDGSTNNQDSGNFNGANSGNSGLNTGYGDNSGVPAINNGFLGNSETNRPNTFNTGNSGNPFNGNLGQREPNNAIGGNSGSQSPVYTPAGQGYQNPINVPESGTGFSGSSNTFGGSGGSSGFGGANTGNTDNIGPNFSATAGPQKPDDNVSGPSGDYSAIPGTPGLDYPILSEIPATKFSCDSQKYPGYYADIDARCQVFHICANGLKYDFLCPNGTVFHQKYFVCVWWNQFDCNSAESLYKLNENLYDNDKIGNLIANAAGATGAQGPSATYTPGFGNQGSSSNFNPLTGSSNSPIDFTPSPSFEGTSINYGSPPQTQGPLSSFAATAGPQRPSINTVSSSGYEGQSPNYDSSNQQPGLMQNTGSSIIPQDTSSSFGSSTEPQSSLGGFTPPSGYDKPSTNYDFLGQPQSQSSNFGSLASPQGQSVDYGTLNNPQGSSNKYGQFPGLGRVSATGSPSSAQGFPSTFGSSPDLQGSSANYPGYQEPRPSAGVGSFSSPQSQSVTYGPYSATQNSVANFGSSVQPQGVTNKGGPPSVPQESVNYEPSHRSQSFSNNLGATNSPLDLSNNFRPSAGSQGTNGYFGLTPSSSSASDKSGRLPESSANLGQIVEPHGFISTDSPITSPQESTTGYDLSPGPQTYSGNIRPSTGIVNSPDNYSQSSGLQKPSFNSEPPPNPQIQSSNYKPLSGQPSDYQSLSGFQAQLPNSGSSYNTPRTSSSFILPASSSSSTNFNPSSIPQGNYVGSGQKSSLQKPSPSYGPPPDISSNFGQQRQPAIFDSTPNPQRQFSAYSSTPSPTGQPSFGQPSASQITSASFSPLSSQLSPNYSAPKYPLGSTLGSNFGGSQGSSPAPFTLAGTSQRPPTVYGPPQSPAFSTPKSQSNYSPSEGNRQQADFGFPASGYSGSSDYEPSLNYPTTIGLNLSVNAGNTEQPPNYSHSGYSSTGVTSSDNFSPPFSLLSTAQPQSYSTESNAPSNTFSVQESSYPSYNGETTLYNNAPFSSSNQQVTKPNREYLPPFRKR